MTKTANQPYNPHYGTTQSMAVTASASTRVLANSTTGASNNQILCRVIGTQPVYVRITATGDPVVVSAADHLILPGETIALSRDDAQPMTLQAIAPGGAGSTLYTSAGDGFYEAAFSAGAASSSGISGGGGTPQTSVPGTLVASSGNVANVAAVATLPAAAGKTTYITGFQLTAGGATVGSVVNATVTGLNGGTLTYTFGFPVGAVVAGQPVNVTFPNPIPASAVNTAIVVTLPAGGGGNTNAAANAQGYQL